MCVWIVSHSRAKQKQDLRINGPTVDWFLALPVYWSHMQSPEFMSAYRKHFIVRYSDVMSTVTDVFVCSLNMEHSSG